MSDKVCVSHAKPEWTDAVTIGGLVQMIVALITLGHDEDTLVTYMYDDDHVWLETVHDIEDEADESRTLRVVHELGPDERDADWKARDGSTRHWDSLTWRNPADGAPYNGDYSLGPYVEVPR